MSRFATCFSNSNLFGSQARLQDTAARLLTRCRYSIKTLASGVGAERDAGCTRADDAAGGGGKKRENSHRVARRIVVARKGKEKESGIVSPPFFFPSFERMM